LGFTRRGDTLRMEPRIPRGWPEFTVEYRFGSASYHITVRNPGPAGAPTVAVTLDGRSLRDATIPLTDDGGRHEVVVLLAAPSALH
ncbi:MAG TPA: hypothetical protein VF625_17620, partial [Longimicrobium sp.]